MNCLEASRLVDPYVDGELDASGAAAMREHVDGCAACKRLVDRRLALSRLLQAVPHHTPADRLRVAVVDAARRRQATRQRAFALATAATLVIAVGGVAIARIVEQRRASAAIATELVAEHLQALRAQHLVDVVSSDQHTVKPWFLGKLDFSPPVEDLAADGFPLAGGRVDRLGKRSIAVLIYHRRLHPIAVFICPTSDISSVAADSRTIRGFHVRHWIKDGMAFWAVSDVNVDELTNFVHMLGG